MKHFFCNKLKVIFLRHAKCEICRIVVFNLLRLKITSEIIEVPLANIGQINNIDKKCMHALTQKGPIRIGKLENYYFLLDSHFFKKYLQLISNIFFSNSIQVPHLVVRLAVITTTIIMETDYQHYVYQSNILIHDTVISLVQSRKKEIFPPTQTNYTSNDWIKIIPINNNFYY